MIKVAEIISDGNIGGAGVLLLNRLRHGNSKIFDTVVILPRGSKLKERFLRIGVRVCEVDIPANRSFSLGDIPKLATVIRHENVQLVNCHASLSSRLAATLVGVPVRIYTRHCVFPVPKKFNCPALRLSVGVGTCILSHAVIAVAHSAKDNLIALGVPARSISVIINGAEPLRVLTDSEKSELLQRLAIPPCKNIITICARLEDCKGHDCFLRAAKILCDESDDYRFLIVGGGSLEEKLKTQSRQMGLDEKVIFTGFCEDVAPFMNITDVNVNCSRGTETSSLALSEGMSLGVVSVASDYGGNPYMVHDGANGYIYPTDNALALAECIKKACEAKNYSALSAASRKRFERELNAERMTRATERLYIKLCESAGKF